MQMVQYGDGKGGALGKGRFLHPVRQTEPRERSSTCFKKGDDIGHMGERSC